MEPDSLSFLTPINKLRAVIQNTPNMKRLATDLFNCCSFLLMPFINAINVDYE